MIRSLICSSTTESNTPPSKSKRFVFSLSLSRTGPNHLIPLHSSSYRCLLMFSLAITASIIQICNLVGPGRFHSVSFFVNSFSIQELPNLPKSLRTADGRMSVVMSLANLIRFVFLHTCHTRNSCCFVLTGNCDEA